MPLVHILRDSKGRTEAAAEGVRGSAANEVRRKTESLSLRQLGNEASAKFYHLVTPFKVREMKRQLSFTI